MTTNEFMRDPSKPSGESDVEHARIVRERELLMQARADMDAGLGVDWDDVEAWLNNLDENENAPMPKPASIPQPRF